MPKEPKGPERPRPASARAAVGLGYLAAIALGAWILLERQAGVRPWNSIWAEDGGIFYPQALNHPLTSLMQSYAGYLQLVPRLIADAVVRLPLRDAAAGFAVTGAVLASACAAVVFRAAAGHVRVLPLRLLLPAGVILLPPALAEVSGNGVNTPWYLLFAAFWVLLWRPRSRWGMAVAFGVCAAAMASIPLAFVYAPLVLVRLIALPRAREQAATAGWAAGGVLQLITIVRSTGLPHDGVLRVGLSFYLHYVLVPAVAGLHIAHVLQAHTSARTVAVAAACLVAAVAAAAMIRGDSRVRLFVTAALGLGLAIVLLSAIIRSWGTPGRLYPVPATGMGTGSRYGTAPILLIDSLAIVAADACLRRAKNRAKSRAGNRARRAWRAIPAVVLAAVLAVSWARDFSYVTLRSSNPPWSQLVTDFQLRCDQHQTRAGRVRMPPMKWIRKPPMLPCSLVGVPRPAVPRPTQPRPAQPRPAGPRPAGSRTGPSSPGPGPGSASTGSGSAS